MDQAKTCRRHNRHCPCLFGAQRPGIDITLLLEEAGLMLPTRVYAYAEYGWLRGGRGNGGPEVQRWKRE